MEPDDAPEGEDLSKREQEAFQRLSNRQAGDVLQDAGSVLIKRLYARLEAGTASAKDMELLAKLLKDSGLMFNPAQPEGGPPPGPSKPADLPDLPDGPGYD